MIASANEISAPDDQIAVLKNTYDALLQLPPEGIAKWFNYQELYMDLANRDNLVLASLAINGYVSDDNFTDFRAWLVLQGRSVYLNALRYADSLADIDVAEGKAYCEEYGYVAMDAYSAKVFYIAAENICAAIWRRRKRERLWMQSSVGRRWGYRSSSFRSRQIPR